MKPFRGTKTRPFKSAISATRTQSSRAAPGSSLHSHRLFIDSSRAAVGGLLRSPGLSWAVLCSPVLSWAVLGSPVLSWDLLGSPVLSSALVAVVSVFAHAGCQKGEPTEVGYDSFAGYSSNKNTTPSTPPKSRLWFVSRLGGQQIITYFSAEKKA